MKQIKDFKYKIKCSATIKVVVPTETDKYLAKASLDNLKQYFPAEINPDENPDLLYIALAGFNGGLINKNGDGVTKETAIAIAEKFKNKYIDLEHDRRQVIGNIIGYGFTRHGQTESISKEEALAYDGPIDVLLSGYIWQMIDEDIANLIIEASDESSLKYGQCSGSWECLYDEYDICVGNRNISEATIISDAVEVEKYSKYLKSNGGKGVDDKNQPVYKIIKGNCLPVGLGIVRSPAAHLSGISVLQNKPEVIKAEELENLEVEKIKANEQEVVILEDEKQMQLAAANLKLEEVTQELNNLKENIIKESKSTEKNKKSVNDNVTKKSNDFLPKKDLSIKPKQKTMKLKFKDYTKETFEALAATDAYDVAQELDKKMSEYAQELDVKKEEAKAAELKAAEVQKTHDSLAAELENLKTELKKINEVRAAEQIQNDFNLRMADLNEKFELDEVKSKSIAGDIRGLDETSYATWLEKMKAFLVAKKFVPFGKDGKPMDDEDKKDKGKDEEEENPDGSKKKAKASLEFFDEIKNLKPDTKPIINKVTGKEQSLEDAFAEAFADVEATSK